MAEITEVAEQVADQIEEVAAVTRKLTGRELGFFVAGAGIGVAAGFAIGYFAAGKRLETKYQKLAEEEISDLRDHYRKKMISLEDQAQSRRPLEELIVERGYAEADQSRYTPEEIQAIEEAEAKAQEEAVVEATVLNVFDEADAEDIWDYEIELAMRASEPDVPYIIHFDEFEENEPSHTQITVTYYEEDDVLADVRDDKIEDMDATIGLGNLGKWGHGSHDPNIVYIRNEELDLDFEVVRDRGSYHDTTNGSIRHSASRIRHPPRRYFDDD